jgi:acetylornithine deacetylase/succinyl-diaminopimelate desuccinylase family protein
VTVDRNGALIVDDVTRLLSELVAIPSVNPMGRPLSGPGIFEAEISHRLEDFFRDLGVAVERQSVAPGRDNILARYEAPKSERTLLFDVHQDTVPVDGMTIEPFHPRIDGGRLFGRGSCDVKGSLAAILIAFARLARERPASSASVIVACTVDEEFTHLGSSRLAATRLNADLAIVAEPTGLDVVNTHKGAVRWKIRCGGVACHSSTPEQGDNAIYRMARVLSALEQYARELATGPRHPMLGPPSLSVGRIEGGQSVNIVPDWCEIEVDRRVNPGEVSAACPRQVLDYLHRALGDVQHIEFDAPWIDLPALGSEASRDWTAPIGEAVARILGRPPRIFGVPFGTDAGPLCEAGIPCLVLGPGDIARAHTKDEWIELEQVRQAVDVYYEIMRSMG